jgi:parvulin-like peptidyl-prolyl isomerase
MVSLIRRFQQPLMILITFLIIIAFVWLYNANSHMDRLGTDKVGTIYGRDITQSEFVRTAKKFELARDLMLYDYLEAMVGPAMTLDQATENYVWNSMVLRHEAKAMGVQPMETEVEEYVKEMQVFQANGTYDGTRFVNFVQNALSPRGFSEEQLFELIRDNLRLRKIKEVLGSTVAPTPAEVRTAFEQRNQRTEASLVRFKLEDVLKDVQLTEEDLKKAFEERSSTLNTEEKRKVKYVAFTLPADSKLPPGKERMDALQVLADKASAFSVEMTEPTANFDEAAKKQGTTAQLSSEFDRNTPPAELGTSEEAVQAAFALTKEQPNSDPVSTDNGYYILQLAEVIPARPLTFEEAKPKLEDQLKNERAREMITLKATEARNKISAAMAQGKSFADAAKEAGVTPEQFPAFSMAEPKFEQPDAREVMMTAFEMKPGTLSQVVPAASGSLIVYVDKRLPVDEQAFEKERSNVAQSLTRGRREGLFREWLKNRRAEANIDAARASA